MAKTIPARISVPRLTDAMYRAATTPGKRNEPTDVVLARYRRLTDMLELRLRNGIEIRFPRTRIRELAAADPTAIGKVEIQPGGDGISVRNLNVDISVAGLLADELGTLYARAIGRRARGRSSAKKAASSRKNGAQAAKRKGKDRAA
jgi:Protein of unknown function (DUF2442)